MSKNKAKKMKTVDDLLAYIAHETKRASKVIRVQDLLAGINQSKHLRKKLVGAWIDQNMTRDKAQAVGYKKIKRALHRELDWLSWQPTWPKKETLFIFASHEVKDEDDVSISPRMNAQPLRQLGDYQHRYDLTMTPYQELLEYRVVMTWRTKHYLFDILAQFLWELTWSGWHQEDLQKQTDKLEKAVAESCDPKAQKHSVTISNSLDLMKMLHLDPHEVDHLDSVEHRYRREAMLAHAKLNLHSFRREAGKVRRILQAEGYIKDAK